MSARPRAQARRRRPARPPAAARRRPPRHRARAARGSTRRGGLVAFVAVSVTFLAGFLIASAFVASAFSSEQDDAALFPSFAPPSIREPGIAGYGVEQLAHACTIMAAGRDLGLDERDQTIAVMTAMGESSLRNIDYGDWETSGVTNPDGSRTTSIGLFQQQDSWGSREARLDPYTAASIFYRAMTVRVPDRVSTEPTLVAHLTQINADPLHYARFWDRAARVVAALNAAPLQERDRIDGIPLCPPV
ncbi:peptidase M23 [Microbacterium sp. B35-04]|nr:peptidase M23 [Microbacterium sp. B35-04]